MANYDWRRFSDAILIERYPEKIGDEPVNGFADWIRFAERFPEEEFRLRQPIKKIDCPRVFVSHKQKDEHFALRIAWLAVRKKFDFWLDVLDPDLQLLNSKIGLLQPLHEARLIAAIIEMALINCTHVVATITNISSSSRWIPYEYGRVKEGRFLVGTNACWLSKSVKNSSLPEYLHLGKITKLDDELKVWLENQYNEWKSKHPKANCSGGIWDENVEEPTTELELLPEN